MGKTLVLFDLDGTLSDDSARRHHYFAKRYEEYFSYDAMIADEEYPEGRALYEEMLESGHDIGYLTARLERNRPATSVWLFSKNYEGWLDAILRPEELADIRPPEFKSSVISDILREGEYDHVILVDNDPLVVAQIIADHGENFIVHADWEEDGSLASIATVQTPLL